MVIVERRRKYVLYDSNGRVLIQTSNKKIALYVMNLIREKLKCQ
jgi:hypothetical protein